MEGEDRAEHTRTSHQTSPRRAAGSLDDVWGEGRRRIHLPITLAMFFLAREDGFTLRDTKLGALLLSGVFCSVAEKGRLPLQQLGSQEMLGLLGVRRPQTPAAPRALNQLPATV